VRTDARLVLVAHSMGGLVARRYLQRYGARRRVAGLCTIGSPHRGSALARWARGRAAAQMRPGNAWLSALPLPAATLPTLSIWSDADNFVAPADSSRLDGARNLQLAGRGHFELLRDAEVHRAVEGFLTGLAAGIRPLDAAPVRVAPAA
jgi:pimeloyl-ACP methyl ester carboxylesterase